MKETKLQPLPRSNDEYWDDAEKYREKPVSVKICKTHTKDNWFNHKGYIDNKDGTISCKHCPWGTQLPGYYRVLDGSVVDLRTINSK